ncbi:hypothetical protein [Primorskyibacter flagellatus]|uniref:hypothetical protein n=1 Tax=Primorskyibacter flagellatus TaxID=1387277 RepID=UPI003A954270
MGQVSDHQIAEKCRRIFGHLPRGRRRDRTADAEKGAVMRIKVASGGLLTDIAPTRIIPIGVIGFWIGILMRKAERILVP